MKPLLWTGLLLVTTAVIGPTSIHAEQLTPQSRLFLSPIANEVGAEPPHIAQQLQSLLNERDLTFEERFDLGTALFFLERSEEAMLAYRFASGATRDPVQRSVALLAAAESTWQQDPRRTPRGEDEQREAFRQAGMLANLAQRHNPSSVEIAKFRYAYWTNAGDALEATVALDHGRRLDMSMDGVEVLEPGHIVLLAYVGAAAAMVFITKLERDGRLSRKDRDHFMNLIFSILSGRIALPH
jgi:hypothetical protein